MPLTDATIRAALPKEKPWKLFDGGGLYLLIHPNGSRYWKMKYRYVGDEGKLSFGVYPQVKLKEARERRDDAKRLMRDGIDPKVQKLSKANDEHTFQSIAHDWLATLENRGASDSETKKAPLSKKTIDKKRFWLDEYVLPYIGKRRPDEVTPPEILTLIRRIEKRGFNETAHRVS